MDLNHRIDVVRTRKIIYFQQFDLNPAKFADRDYRVCESMPIDLSQHDISVAWRPELYGGKVALYRKFVRSASQAVTRNDKDNC